jgi:hypothetical protein
VRLIIIIIILFYFISFLFLEKGKENVGCAIQPHDLLFWGISGNFKIKLIGFILFYFNILFSFVFFSPPEISPSLLSFPRSQPSDTLHTSCSSASYTPHNTPQRSLALFLSRRDARVGAAAKTS